MFAAAVQRLDRHIHHFCHGRVNETLGRVCKDEMAEWCSCRREFEATAGSGGVWSAVLKMKMAASVRFVNFSLRSWANDIFAH